MERCQVFVEGQPVTIFVFEGLIAELKNPRLEKIALAAHRWSLALDAWEIDLYVCACIRRFMSKHPNIPVEVLTWRPQGFGDCVADLLWNNDLPIRCVQSGMYEETSPLFAVDKNIQVVYDPDPAHSSGYGFKARQFSAVEF